MFFGNFGNFKGSPNYRGYASCQLTQECIEGISKAKFRTWILIEQMISPGCLANIGDEILPSHKGYFMAGMK